jgi:hypothetical protein
MPRARGEGLAQGSAVDRSRIFLLSPANVGGERAALLFNERAGFSLARRLRTREGAPVGEVFSFVSGLYFRGKLTYASRFGQPPEGVGGVWIITPSRGLIPPDTPATLSLLRRFADVDIHLDEARYRRPLARSAQALAADPNVDAILLGSIATGKYVDILLSAFGERLLFPVDFVGRGDMSRGALLLRSAREGRELDYAPVAGAVRRGRRAPRVWG